MNTNKHFQQYLCPPGNGVYTVHTASERKAVVHQSLYGTSDLDEVQKAWLSSLDQLENNQKPCLLGATCDTGGGILRGTNWGPLYLRQSFETLQKRYFDIGDIRTIPHLLHDKYLNVETLQECRAALYGDKNSELPVSPLSILADTAHTFFNQSEQSLITLGGDHSISYPMVSEWIKARRAKGKKVAVIHFDAHTDLLDKRLGIDLCFGSWAYHCLDLLEKPSHMIQLGIRSSGYDKAHWESKLGVKQYWTQEIRNSGAQAIAQEICKQLKSDGIEELYLSFDIDALDTEYASSTGTPEDHGLFPHEACEIIETISEVSKFHSSDLVEVSPFLHTGGAKISPEPETTLLSSKIIFQKMLEVLEK